MFLGAAAVLLATAALACWVQAVELAEGTADHASWTLLHELGLATRDQLLGTREK